MRLKELQLSADAQSKHWNFSVPDLANQIPAIFLAGEKNYGIVLEIYF